MMMYVLLLFDDLLVEVLRYLRPEDGLCSCLLLSKHFNRCIKERDDTLWRSHVEELWKSCGWSYNIPVDANVYSRIKRLSLTKLREKLRGCDLIRCVEKEDFCRHLVAYLAFKDVRLQCARTLGVATRSSPRKFLPNWSLAIGPYRASLYYTRRELARKEISQDELCNARWHFVFKYNEYAFGETGTQWESTFYSNFTIRTHLHDQTMRWQWVEDGDGTTMIQVEQYPPLSFKRLPDGRWYLENMYVFFEQVESFTNDENILC